MRRLTLTDARTKMQQTKPWTFRMECRTGGSNKFWMATGRGYNEPVEVIWGKIGHSPNGIRVKDWSYVENTAPLKENKGYIYVATPHVRVRQQTIDAHVAAHGNKPRPPAPVLVPPPPTLAQTATASMQGATVQVPPANITEWDCRVGGLKVRLKTNAIEIAFDVFPAPWQPSTAYHTFKDDLEAFCLQFMGCPIQTWWGGDSGEIFRVSRGGSTLFAAVVGWIQKQIPGKMTPLLPPSSLTGPFKRIRFVQRTTTGWLGLDEYGDKVLDLTRNGARKLLQDYPAHVSMAGL